MATTDKVIVEFGSRTDAFIQGANQVKGKVSDLTTQLASGLRGAMFVAFSIEALKKFRTEFQQVSDDLETVRRRTNANKEDLQVWQKQIEKIGGKMEDVAGM